jgi:nucleotide-binding universal stress UspA family protein
MAQARVVVGVDGSPLSMAAVARAAQVASARGYTLHVLHAFAPDLPMLGFGELSDGSAMVSNHAKRLVADGVNRAHAVDPSLEVTTGIRDGYASQALVDASRSAALVVVGAMGHGVFSRASVGAVAMQVVTHARCPVLVVGHETAGGSPVNGRVVVGVDGSKPSLRALGVAFDEALRTGGWLDVLHAWEAHSATDPTLSTSSSWSTYEANLEKIVESAIAPRRAANPDVKVDYEVVRSEPVRALVDRTEGAALLVVGSRGSGGFPGLHVGSTALRLISRCHCPLLMTR